MGVCYGADHTHKCTWDLDLADFNSHRLVSRRRTAPAGWGFCMDKTSAVRVAIVGATGAVGRTLARVMSERHFPVREFIPIATDGSTGRQVEAFGKNWSVCGAGDADFRNIDICFFSAGARVSEQLVPVAIDQGASVVDNTSAFRMRSDVPLVVPEINPSSVTKDTRLVACPNCTTIQLVMSLAPLQKLAAIERVVVTSFQSVSGAGKEAINELETQIKLGGDAPKPNFFEKPIAFNCLPQVGEMLPSGYTSEEEKIIEETRKILDAPDIEVVPTAVRVPVRVGHSVSVCVHFDRDVKLEGLKDAWRDANGVTYDDGMPTPLDAAGQDAVIVGRLRHDPARSNVVAYWVVGDNLRKGAATNSVQIADLMLAK